MLREQSMTATLFIFVVRPIVHYILAIPLIACATTVWCLYEYGACVQSGRLLDFRVFEFSVSISVFRLEFMSRVIPVCVFACSNID